MDQNCIVSDEEPALSSTSSVKSTITDAEKASAAAHTDHDSSMLEELSDLT